MSYIKSENIQIYPSAYRGTGVNNALFNPESRIPSELNITNQTNNFGLVSFIVTPTDLTTPLTVNDYITFVIHGYWFKIKLTTDLFNAIGANPLYAQITLTDKNPSPTEYQYAGTVLESYNSDLQLDFNDSGVYKFSGLNLSTSPFTDNTGQYSIQLLTYDSGYYIPAKSILKLESKFIKNSDVTPATSINRQLNSEKVLISSSAKSLTLTEDKVAFVNSSNQSSIEGPFIITQTSIPNSTNAITINTDKIALGLDSSGNGQLVTTTLQATTLKANGSNIAIQNLSSINTTDLVFSTNITTAKTFKVVNSGDKVTLDITGKITASNLDLSTKLTVGTSTSLSTSGTTALIETPANGLAIRKSDSSAANLSCAAISASTIIASGSIQAQSVLATSDRRLKENIEPYEPTNSILDLPLVKYDFIEGEKNKIGCIAQDLQGLFPELVHENEEGYLGIEESKLVYLLLYEVKKLKKEIEELKK